MKSASLLRLRTCIGTPTYFTLSESTEINDRVSAETFQCGL